MSVELVKTPDIGGESGEIIEILVAVGDQVKAEQSLLVLESAKASMEVPSPKSGKVIKLHVAVGDSLEEGNPILELEIDSDSGSEEAPATSQADGTAEETAQEDSGAGEKHQPASSKSADTEQKAASDDSGTDQSASESTSSRVLKVPDIGSDKAEIIEVSVKVGAEINAGDTLVVAESDKASVEIPAESGGRVESVHVKEGDQIAAGQDLVTILVSASAPDKVEQPQKPRIEKSVDAAAAQPDKTDKPASASTDQVFQVPDLGSENAEVIEIPVAVGDKIKAGDTLVVAESDKASLEIPAEADGEIVSLHCGVGDKISQGMELVTLKVVPQKATTGEKPGATPTEEKPQTQKAAAEAPESKLPSAGSRPEQTTVSAADVYAGPAVRQLARELGVDLGKVKASGPRGRLLKEDLQAFVKTRMQTPEAGGSGVPPVAVVDWSKFGSVRVEPMSRIQRLTADNMTRSWLNVPHVTQFDDADVTELEDYRAMIKHEGKARGIKMTPLAFIVNAAYKTLKAHPKFNASLAAGNESLVFRDYFHIGVAVDTPAGLMVPVIRDVDQKDIWQLAAEIADLAGKAKDGKLKPTEMQGACFTISSLGAIGGRGFTPIVPAPQVGILGVSKTSVQPVWDGEAFQPRQLMPLALSYDHRAVNGADAGRFLSYLVEQLGAVENIWSD